MDFVRPGASVWGANAVNGINYRLFGKWFERDRGYRPIKRPTIGATRGKVLSIHRGSRDMLNT